jgi:hypothetical protein
MTGPQQIAASIFDTNLQARTAVLVSLAILAAILTIVPTAQAQTFTILHNFTGGGDGSYPGAGLTLYGQGNFYGGTAGKRQGSGWVLAPILELPGGAGGSWIVGQLTVGPDGALYGAAMYGGRATLLLRSHAAFHGGTLPLLSF